MKRPAAQIGVALTRVRIEAAVLRRRVRNRMQQWEFRWFWWLQLGVFIDGLRTLYPDLDYDTLPGPGLQREERERDFLLRALIES